MHTFYIKRHTKANSEWNKQAHTSAKEWKTKTKKKIKRG